MLKGIALDVILELGAMPMKDIWKNVYDTLRNNRALASKKVDLYTKKKNLEEIYSEIYKNNMPHFGVNFANLKISCSPVTNWEHIVLFVWDDYPEPLCDWAQIAERFSQQPGFVQAWLSDREYDYWQNATSPHEYDGTDRSCAGLPMKPNGLPPPLDAMIIDTSANPGRRVIKVGYVEAVGSRMWLGDELWARTGTDKAEFLRQFGDNCEVLPNGAIRLHLSDEPFTEQSDVGLQERLRAALYG